MHERGFEAPKFMLELPCSGTIHEKSGEKLSYTNDSPTIGGLSLFASAVDVRADRERILDCGATMDVLECD